MKSCKKGYYYCNTEQKCKPIPDGYTVKDDGFLVKEDRQIKKIVKQLRKSVKSHAKQADTLEKKIEEAANPAQQAAIAIDMKKKGKKPKNMTEGKSPAWQRKAGKSESGGLNAKGVASYRAANPGSKLKTAVTTKPSKLKKGSKSAKRRLSFCRRMRGMNKKLTSAKTARDPDSRINKALRKWNCSFEPEHGEMISEGKVSGMIKSLKRKTKVLEKGQKRDAGAIAAKIMREKEHKKYVNFLPMDEEKKKCGEGEYYCNDDKKCKPIPKGYRIGYGGYLKPENKEDESNGKKGGSNGNGNGNGGNGNGHGGNGNGGNGGGNGGGE